jgi:hypothetical protein
MEAAERLGRATDRVEASGQKSAFGWAAILQAVTRVKLEQTVKDGLDRLNARQTDAPLTRSPRSEPEWRRKRFSEWNLQR